MQMPDGRSGDGPTGVTLKIVKDQRENSSISKQSPRPLEELVAVPNVTAITVGKRTPGRALSMEIMAAQASRQ
jgi:hypothetical protein